MIPFISNLFQFPVTRKEVLLRAMELQKAGSDIAASKMIIKKKVEL